MTVFGQQNPTTSDNDYNVMSFVVQQMLLKVNTMTLVEVMACTNDGGIVPVGTVNVRCLVNIMTGNRIAIPHGTIFNVPYQRLQGGANAIILDPQAGDIGLCGFCMRDISGVKNAQAAANPGSFRAFDWADAVYIGGVLNGLPTQYIAFNTSGIAISSPTKISISSPIVEISGGGTKIDGKVFLTHEHTGVQSGASDTGPVA